MPDTPRPPSSDDAPPPTIRVSPDQLRPVEVPPSSRDKFRATVAASSTFGQAGEAVKAPYLTMIAGPQLGVVVKLSGDEIVLGRAPESTCRVDSEGVSWRHARILRLGSIYAIEDLKSTNGTGVNDKRITSAPLSDGDRIQLGPSVLLRFNLWDDLEAGMQQQLYESAVKDPLTKAYNRKHFQERLEQEIGFAARHGAPLSLVIFDIDFFKKVNDTYGHAGGDAVLRAVSAGMLATIRAEDVFARIGGEEFVVLARAIDVHGAVAFAERVRAGIEQLVIPWENGRIPVTSSFGVAALDELPKPEGDALLALADKRLYAAKGSGRNRVVGP
ncbi:MAG: GGDEF domain-containing protein [Myxococcales bacterium]|nr:GGDEF domain-containing protein [Myxococcales bacterium]